MPELITNFNNAPYYDDYDPNKQYYRILFRPSRAVQVRELNQLQTAIQEQITRFGNHVFKDGSIVSGCNINHIPHLAYVRVNNVYNNINSNTAFDDQLLNFLVVSPTTDVRAVVRLVKAGYELQYPDTNTLYIDYVKTGRDVSNNEVSTFVSGETVEIYSSTQDRFADTLDINNLYNTINVYTANVSANQSSVGDAYGVSVGEGVVYQKGYFVNVLPHTITVKDYDTDVEGMLVGFDTSESIVTHLQDSSLIDPADTSNRNGIGADRLKLTPRLIALHRDDITDEDEFFPIIEYSRGKPIVQNSDPEYSKLGDYIAAGIYEPHGDFFIKPFIVSSEENSNTALFNYVINPGLAYVKGERVELLAARYLPKERATVTENQNAAITTLNYGNYVIVNEMKGMFDTDQFASVNIYDQPQTSVTDGEAPNATPTGAIVGTARVKAVLYDSGRRSSPDGRFRFYISDIVMNSGKSFSSDAKSFVSPNVARADIVLENGKAVIKESGSAALIFDMGVEGMRRLRDQNGVNDTQFIYRDISTATLQANGSVTFTLNSPHAGGNERFFASTGALSTANKERVNVVLGGTIQTVNLTGTIQSQTSSTAAGSNTIVGTGTTFLTDFAVGDTIRVAANTTSEYFRRVVNIANNTHMAVNQSIAQANAAATYNKVWTAGSVLPLESANVNVISQTQFSVSLGYSLTGTVPQTVAACYPVLRTQAVEAKKEVRKNRFVRISCANNVATTTGPWDLGISDVYKIENVYVGTTYSTSNPERSTWFTLDYGQSDTAYDHAKLVLNPAFKDQITSATRILVELSYFAANTTSGIGFFSVDSYPVRDPGEVANTTNISYAEIPVVAGYDLRNCVDFRPRKSNTATDTTDPATATINPGAGTYVVPTTGLHLGAPDTNFQADIEYYLPRIDLVQVNRNGAFTVKSSIPSINPKTPAADADSMPVAVAYVPPYPSLTANERPIYNRLQKSISTNVAGNKAYTMRDISVLDQRINRLEYYQRLSMLEAQARDYTVKDENGLDRFKNGIFADPFNNHLLGDVSNFEYSIAIDERETVARPKIEKNDIDLKVSNTSNVVTHGSIASLPYTGELFIQQPYASKYRNATESVWKWEGNLSLHPSYDHFRDEEKLPDVNVNIDLSTAWDQFASSPFAQTFGDWRTVNSQTSSTETREGSLTGGGTITTTTTTTNILQRQVSQLEVAKTSNSYDLGSYVTDFTINPYMRSRQVAFIATGLKPNTNYWAFFDKKAVSSHCAPATLAAGYNPETGIVNITQGQESQIVNRSANWGTQLTSDSDGNLYGIFRIPEGEFRVGDRQFMLANVDDLTTGWDAITSSTRAVYTASNMTITSRSATINTIEPSISSRTTTETIVDTSTQITQRQEPEPARPPFRPEIIIGPAQIGEGSDDPLGQSFYIDLPRNVPGVFLDEIGVFFRTKDSKLGISCVICELSAGVPDTTKIVAKAYLKPSQISTSNDGTVETKFKFANIPYLSAQKYYAFFLQPDGNSPEYTVWMAEIGGVDLATGTKIHSNPYIGTAFVSANSTTWNALQTEDVKFNIYVCVFSPLTGSITFTDQDDEYITVNGFTVSNSEVFVEIGDLVYTQNSTGGLNTSNTAPFGVVQYVDRTTDTVVLDGSRGGFTANTVIEFHRPAQTGNVSSVSANTRIALSTIESVDNVEYSIVVPRIGAITPSGTNISYSFKGMDSSESEDPNWMTVQPETELELLDKMRIVKSKSNRNIVSKSTQFQLNLSSESRYTTPIVDLRRRSAFMIKNLVNNDITNEHTRNGNATTKYVSQKIVLAEGQDAEDIRVIVTGYRPAGTDIHCYVKFLNGEDPDTFESKLWTKLTMSEGASSYSSLLDVNDYREYVYSVPSTAGIAGQAFLNVNNNNILQYTGSGNSVYVGYKTFAIKLVLTSESPEKAPRMRDVSAIALQI